MVLYEFAGFTAKSSPITPSNTAESATLLMACMNSTGTTRFLHENIWLIQLLRFHVNGLALECIQCGRGLTVQRQGSKWLDGSRQSDLVRGDEPNARN